MTKLRDWMLKKAMEWPTKNRKLKLFNLRYKTFII